MPDPSPSKIKPVFSDAELKGEPVPGEPKPEKSIMGPNGGLSVADLEKDPDIKYHLLPTRDDKNGTFAWWSRENMTGFEKKVWKILGEQGNPWLFIPQVEILGYVVDFYSPLYNTALEADGPIHARSIHQDRLRDRILLTKKGIKTLRLNPVDVDTSTAQDIYGLVEAFVQKENEVTVDMVDEDEGGL